MSAGRHVEIRTAGGEDLEAFVTLALGLTRFNCAHQPSLAEGVTLDGLMRARRRRLEAAFTDRRDREIWLARVDGVPAGYLIARLHEPQEHEHDVHHRLGRVDEVYVDPSFRGDGIGRRLLETAAAWMRRRGARLIRLEVFGWNEPALGFYQRLGFRITEYVLEAPLDAYLTSRESTESRQPRADQMP